MKLSRKIPVRRPAGILLIECVVYIAVFSILLIVATTAFYFCLDHSKALRYATDDISSALRAGERWRADVRRAAGTISVTTNSTGETLTIPQGRQRIIYRFTTGEIHRQSGPSHFSELILAKIKTSHMTKDVRGELTAWRWEVTFGQRRPEMHLPLLFTFEAVPANHEN
jgi:Tfp pilus assembly protein PilE